VHGGERDGQGGGILIAHIAAGRDVKQPAVIRQCVFCECSAARSHHAVADLDAFGIGTEFGDFACPFHAEHSARAAGVAMGVALGHAEVGSIEAAGANPNQHLRTLRRGLCDVGDFSAIGAVDKGLHDIILCCWRGDAPILPLRGADRTSWLRAGFE
jgi:hypothetical protein